MIFSYAFPSSLLKKLYTKDKLSTYKIADILKCDPKTIRRYLEKYHIKTRSITKPKISEAKLRNLYEDEEMSLFEIGKVYKMTSSGILKRMRKFHIPMRSSWEVNTAEKKVFSGSQGEKAYLIGFRLGDLGVRKSSDKTQMIKICSNTTKKEQVILINNLFKKYAKVWISKPNNTGVISVSTILHPSFSFLLPKSKKVESWIISNNINTAAFAGGYIDAEGSFGIYDNRAKFRLGSYDKEILKQIHGWFIKNNIKSIFVLEREKKTGQNDDFWRITINEAKSLVKLNKIIFPYLRHIKRKADFTKVMENVNMRAQNGTIQL
jgi:hypothetical protein